MDPCRSLHEFTLEKFGRLDFLVNNGGGQFPCGAADMTLKGWNAVVETNLTGTYLMCREAHRQYMRDHGGAIVNIIADMFRGFPMMSHTGEAWGGEKEQQSDGRSSQGRPGPGWRISPGPCQ